MRKKTKSSSAFLRHLLGTTEQRPIVVDPRYVNQKPRKRKSSKTLFTVRSKAALANKQRP